MRAKICSDVDNKSRRLYEADISVLRVRATCTKVKMMTLLEIQTATAGCLHTGQEMSLGLRLGNRQPSMQLLPELQLKILILPSDCSVWDEWFGPHDLRATRQYIALRLNVADSAGTPRASRHPATDSFCRRASASSATEGVC